MRNHLPKFAESVLQIYKNKINIMKTKEELLKIYSAYLPYDLQVRDTWGIVYQIYGITNKLYDNYGNIGLMTNNRVLDMDPEWDNKPILYSMDMLTKEELIKEGIQGNINWITEERFYWTDEYGFEKWLKMIPYEHIEYLLSKHFNVFGLDESEYIKKELIL